MAKAEMAKTRGVKYIDHDRPVDRKGSVGRSSKIN